MADYPEQVLLTGIKKNKHCPICLVPPNERGNLTGKWSPRTHEYTRDRIEAQRRDPGLTASSMAIHSRSNFAWAHHLVNIHAILTVDILHQLLKGIVMRLVTWIQSLIKRDTQGKEVDRAISGRSTARSSISPSTELRGAEIVQEF